MSIKWIIKTVIFFLLGLLYAFNFVNLYIGFYTHIFLSIGVFFGLTFLYFIVFYSAFNSSSASSASTDYSKKSRIRFYSIVLGLLATIVLYFVIYEKMNPFQDCNLGCIILPPFILFDILMTGIIFTILFYKGLRRIIS